MQEQTNYVEGFRFTDGYEEVYRRGPRLCTYVMAEWHGRAGLLACQDYEDNGDGTFSAFGVWYGLTTSELDKMERANMRDASRVIAAEYMRALANDPYETEEQGDEMYTDLLLEFAACHVLETAGAPDVFEGASMEAWANALQRSGIDAIC